MTSSSPPAPTPGVTVRLARPADLDAAGHVVRLAYTGDGFTSPDYLDILADARDRSRDSDIAVAVDHRGVIVGSITFVLPGSRWAELSRPGEAEFRMLGVHPQAQRRGVGQALTRWCIDRARVLGARRLLLCSRPEMTAAHRLYERLGFVRRPDLDLTPAPELHLLGFSLDLRHAPDGSALDGSTAPAQAPGRAPNASR